MKQFKKINPYEILAIFSLFLGIGIAGASDHQELPLKYVCIGVIISLVGFCVFGTLARASSRRRLKR